MEFFDCNKYFDKTVTEVFQSISQTDLRNLGMEDQERQGIFKPVATSINAPIRATLLGLNGYVKEDYREFFARPNPMVYASQVHPPLIIKLPAVIEKYRAGLPSIANSSFYFTNFVKIYPPASQFDNAKGMELALQNSSSLTMLFRQYLKDEILGLVKDGCRIFICFGNSASHYFNETFSLNDVKAKHQIIAAYGKSNMVRGCMINDELVYIVSERHYAYYSNATTDYLVRTLAEQI